MIQARWGEKATLILSTRPHPDKGLPYYTLYRKEARITDGQ